MCLIGLWAGTCAGKNAVLVAANVCLFLYETVVWFLWWPTYDLGVALLTPASSNLLTSATPICATYLGLHDINHFAICFVIIQKFRKVAIVEAWKLLQSFAYNPGWTSPVKELHIATKHDSKSTSHAVEGVFISKPSRESQIGCVKPSSWVSPPTPWTTYKPGNALIDYLFLKEHFLVCTAPPTSHKSSDCMVHFIHDCKPFWYYQRVRSHTSHQVVRQYASIQCTEVPPLPAS